MHDRSGDARAGAIARRRPRARRTARGAPARRRGRSADRGRAPRGGSASGRRRRCRPSGRTRPRPGWRPRRSSSSGSPAAIGVPPSSVSSTAVRMNDVTGVVQRSTSSTAVGSSEGSAASRSSCSGCSASATSAAGDRVAGGLVAGHEQLDEEHPELVVGERLAVLLVGGEHRHDVVAWLLPARRGQAEQLDGHLAEQRVALVLGPVGGAGDGRLRPAEQPLLVARAAGRAAGRSAGSAAARPAPR